ncbi:OmpA family protein [Schaalia sp. 19OD2882]|uniref:OmpA family protein n=1 Tax=Schaalia sp. 19OD2882 TaxID=2794089 RepID=UPI001C1EFB0B|nr:OmpA family protein [Schaalia sp. 19OD2882]QWW19025.1 OmpA family protein [Schaalia sp. 19OD2882]
MVTLRRSRVTSCVCIAVLALAASCLTGCGGSSGGSGQDQSAGATAEKTSVLSDGEAGESSASSSQVRTDLSGLPAVPGFAPGEIPPIPMFQFPDTSVVSGAQSKFSIETFKALSGVPGVSVAAAKCNGTQVVSGTTVLYGDGSGHTSQSGREVVNYGNGAGNYSDGTVTITNYGNGAAHYENTATQESIDIYESGAASYKNVTTGREVNVYESGAANLTDPAMGLEINIYDSGAGNYTRGDVQIVNDGDGSGRYEGPGLTIVNHGDGTGQINDVAVHMEKIPPLARLQKIPPIPAVKPIESCGTVITLEDGVLFDFGKSEVRADARSTISTLAGVFTSLSVPSATVTGHTDSVSDEAFNQTLSEQRAAAVVEALQAVGVKAALSAEGKGESQPVAPNENADGSDNPSGRQLNRRVEIFVPAF